MTNKAGESVYFVDFLLQAQPSATRFPLDQLRREARVQAKVAFKRSSHAQKRFLRLIRQKNSFELAASR